MPHDQRAALRAGAMQRKYRQRPRATRGSTGMALRTMPDFLVGARAMLQCEGLITRDAGLFRDYFTGLKVIEPSVG